MSTILAIDYGLARIGLAISYVGLAEPLTIINNDVTSNEPIIGSQALAEIKQIVKAEKVDKIVLGISEQAMAKKILEFFEILQSTFNLDIILVDEVLSSYEVEQRLKELPKKKRRQAIDHYAAAIILENYLDLC
ncbi:MAG TPA: Holliday junction resolvase RuvX [Candidatus Woesebacteria bacterium]|nr:Holliday junction resolvase RuvX [Candidatus Woesebacteria bacterium]